MKSNASRVMVTWDSPCGQTDGHQMSLAVGAGGSGVPEVNKFEWVSSEVLSWGGPCPVRSHIQGGRRAVQ